MRVRRRLRGSGLPRAVRRFRVPLALLLGLAAAVAVLVSAPGTQAETTTAVRTVNPVAAGEVLTEHTLEQVELDTEAVPEAHTADPEEFIGRTVAAALPAGAVVHDSQLVGPGLLDGHPEGTVAVPVRPADTAILGLLSPGQRVEVLTSSDAPESGSGTERIAAEVPVLWIPQDEGENWLGAADQARHVVILAVNAETAERIAQASHQGRLHLSLVGS